MLCLLQLFLVIGRVASISMFHFTKQPRNNR